MLRNSFTFGGVDMRETYGICISEAHDVLFPQLRERKVVVPGRSGAYDYGAFAYDERILSLDCDIVRPTTRAQLREIAYVLAQKNRIVLWNEPDKYYIGRIYNAEELERVGTTQKHFTLEFTCDPFAYGQTVTQDLATGDNPVPYQGTAPTPSLIVLRNVGADPIQNLQITAVFKR